MSTFLQCEHPVVPFQSICTRVLTEMVVHYENLKKPSKGKRELYSHARRVPPVWLPDEIEILVNHYDFPGDYHGCTEETWYLMMLIKYQAKHPRLDDLRDTKHKELRGCLQKAQKAFMNSKTDQSALYELAKSILQENDGNTLE